MNTEEKAKAYDEALKRARKELQACGSTVCDAARQIFRFFPELKESEDEKIRKELIKHLREGAEGYEPAGNTEDYTRWLSWVEKQKEYESTDFEYVWNRTDCDALTSALDKYSEEAIINMCHAWYDKGIELERKSWLEKQGKETSWKPSKEEMDVLYGLAYITNQYDEHKEEVITRLYQDLKREFFNGSSYENMFPNTSTEDDVRRRSTIQVLEYARSLDAYNQYGKADIDKNIAWLEKQGEKKPFDYENANIQQKDFAPQEDAPRYSIGDVLCDKSCTTLNKDAQPNYEIVDIRNGLYICDKGPIPISLQDEYELVAKKIEQKPTNEEMKEALRTEYEKGRADAIAEMKSSWSEEDERAIGIIKIALKHPYDMEGKWDRKFVLDWLKFLKDRVQPQSKHKWSIEDERVIAIINNALTESNTPPDDYDKVYDWLESIRQKIGG